MKILHLIYTVKVSGAEKYLKHLLPGLLAHNIESHLIVVCPKNSAHLFDDFKLSLETVGVPTTIYTYNKTSLLFAAQKVNRYCKRNSINTIHSHLVNSDLIAVILKKVFNSSILLVSTKHGYDEKVLEIYKPGVTKATRNLYYYITRFLQKNIDKNFAVSQGIADLYYDLGLTDCRYPVIHHGINIPLFDKSGYEKKCRQATPQLIIVGRIEEFKGHRYLVDALAKIVTRYPECRLLILGEGSLKDKLVTQINSLNLSDNVSFMGFQSHPYSFIANSDVIVLPSLFEPFGLVYIEAFALKIPVVAFDTPAGNEILENNATGLMVPRASSNELAEKIMFLLDNEMLRKRLTDNAYKVYCDRFTIETMVARTARWYKENLDA